MTVNGNLSKCFDSPGVSCLSPRKVLGTWTEKTAKVVEYTRCRICVCLGGERKATIGGVL